MRLVNPCDMRFSFRDLPISDYSRYTFPFVYSLFLQTQKSVNDHIFTSRYRTTVLSSSSHGSAEALKGLYTIKFISVCYFIFSQPEE